jgi:hypothetical protein
LAGVAFEPLIDPVDVDSRHQQLIMLTGYTMTRTPDFLPGTLDLLILRTLQKDALHGWAISERISRFREMSCRSIRARFIRRSISAAR